MSGDGQFGARERARVGGHRRLGCGLFVGHKSSAAVGAPA
jgi:hypothetical protein